MNNFKKILLLLLALTISVFVFTACTPDDPEPQKPTVGTVNGVVTDSEGEPLEAVEVYYSEEDFVETDEDGKFSIKNVTVGDLSITAILKGYSDTTVNVTADDFDTDGKCNVTVTMADGIGTIKGTVSDYNLTTKKLAGVTVSIGNVEVTTDANGMYEIKDVAMQGTKTLTATIEGYGQSRKTVTVRSFDSKGVATVDFQLVQNDLAEIPGIKPSQLEALTILPADKLTLKRTDLENLNRSPDGLASSSKVESHSEGLCINADTKTDNSNMVAYIYGKVTIDDNHQYLTAYARIFYGQNGGGDHDTEAKGDFTNAKLAELGVYLIDENGNLITNVDAFQKITTEGFMPVTYDLSAYKGQTVVFILGTKTGYHCCLDKVEFTATEPQYLTVNGVAGMTSIMLHDKVTDTSFDAAALKEKWAISGGVGIVTEGVQLNGADPWKAEDFNTENPQAVNSYMYITTDITAQNSNMTLSVTLTNLDNCKDPASADPNHIYYPYISVIILDRNGNVLNSPKWEKVEVSENNQVINFNYDLSQYAGQDVTIVIACNVGYRATVTGVTLAAPKADDAE